MTRSMLCLLTAGLVSVGCDPGIMSGGEGDDELDSCDKLAQVCKELPEACTLYAQKCTQLGGGWSPDPGGGTDPDGETIPGSNKSPGGSTTPGTSPNPGGDTPKPNGNTAPGGKTSPSPGGSFPPVTDHSAKGPWATTSTGKGGPGGAFTLHYPQNLGQGGVRHPVITWGNGTGATPWVYGGLLSHWASHGFVVIASNSTQTGSGKAMLQGVSWLIAENARQGSVFFGKIDIAAVGASGHSQGGGGSINAGTDSRVICTAPIEPAPGSVKGLKGPMFVIAGSADTIVSSWLVTSMVYNPSPVKTVYGTLKGATHFTPVGAANGMRGYLTAWFRLHLMQDTSVHDTFFGASCGICTDGKWTVQRKNL